MSSVLLRSHKSIQAETVTTNREIVANHLAYTHLYMFSSRHYMSKAAYDKVNEEYNKKSEELLENLPLHVHRYKKHCPLGPKTINAYLRDITDFYNFLVDSDPDLKSTKDITPEYLNTLALADFDAYFDEIKNRYGTAQVNERSRDRRLSSLKSLFSFLVYDDDGENGRLGKVAAGAAPVDTKVTNANVFKVRRERKPKSDVIVRLTTEEMDALLQNVDAGYTLTKHQKERHERYQYRDLAMISLMLGTGIRVSECASMDIKDVHLKESYVKVYRKGKKETKVPLPDNVKYYLQIYMNERKYMDRVVEQDKAALFISSKYTRITTRSIQRILKKYAQASIVGDKTITPHTLRKSYGTKLYEVTGDIKLVADALSHESVETTKRAYIADNEELKADKLRSFSSFNYSSRYNSD